MLKFTLFALLILTAAIFSDFKSHQLAVSASSCEDSPEFKELLKSGDILVTKGRSSYAEAIAKFSKALELCSHSPKALFRRGELKYLTRAFDEALQDFDEVLAREPSHRRALEYRVKVFEAVGRPEEAAQDYERLATVYAQEGKTGKAEWAAAQAVDRRKVLVEWNAIKDQVSNLKSIDPSQRGEISKQCVRVLRALLEVSGGGSKIDLRMKIAECAVQGRLLNVATEEINKILKLQPNNLEASALHAQLLRSLGSMDRARAEIRRCLKLDPEFKACKELHKSMKKYTKVADVVDQKIKEKEWDVAIAEIDKLIALGPDEAPNVEQLWRWKCEGFVHLRDVKKGLAACDHVIQMESGSGGDEKNPQLVDPFLWRADLHLMDDNLDQADADVKKAHDANSQSDRVREFQEKIEKLKRQGARKDYYKILGVSKAATESQIRKAYRKMSKQYHPDLLRSKDLTDTERSRYDKLYRDCNEAKEILLDKDKRARYDAGEDPTKPPEQQGHHHHGFHPFHGGGQHFHFGGGGGGGFPGGFQFHFG